MKTYSITVFTAIALLGIMAPLVGNAQDQETMSASDVFYARNAKTISHRSLDLLERNKRVGLRGRARRATEIDRAGVTPRLRHLKYNVSSPSKRSFEETAEERTALVPWYSTMLKNRVRATASPDRKYMKPVIGVNKGRIHWDRMGVRPNPGEMNGERTGKSKLMRYLGL